MQSELDREIGGVHAVNLAFDSAKSIVSPISGTTGHDRALRILCFLLSLTHNHPAEQLPENAETFQSQSRTLHVSQAQLVVRCTTISN